jgi:hypothetical protein
MHGKIADNRILSESKSPSSNFRRQLLDREPLWAELGILFVN